MSSSIFEPLSVLLTIALCLVGAHVLTDLDLRRAEKSLCSGGKCTVPANTEVVIAFKITVGDYNAKESTVSNLLFSAKLGETAVFSGYHGCLTNGAVKVQRADCSNKVITSKTWPVTVKAVISKSKTSGTFVLSDKTNRFKGSLTVTVN